MPKGYRAAAAVVGACGLILAIAVLSRDDEPRYQGRTLQEWILSQGPTPSQESKRAMRFFVTNSFPEALEALAYDPEPRQKRIAAMQRLAPTWLTTGRLGSMLFKEDKRLARAEFMAIAFGIAEPDEGIPALSTLLLSSNSWPVTIRVASLLSAKGIVAKPSFYLLLTNHHPYRACAVEYFPYFAATPSEAQYIIGLALRDQDPWVRAYGQRFAYKAAFARLPEAQEQMRRLQ